jgi:hypothetical protein
MPRPGYVVALAGGCSVFRKDEELEPAGVDGSSDGSARASGRFFLATCRRPVTID